MEELLKRLKKDDKKAFEEIVRIYENQLFTIAKFRIGDEALAQDAVQETFLVLYLKAREIKDYKKLKSWLTIVLINKCNDIMRKNKIIQVSFEGNDFNNFLYVEEEIETILDKVNFIDLVSCLNVDERTILSMFYEDEYTIDDISNILKISEGTIKSKISRAKLKLKNKIGGEYKSE